jgi:sec-independent protein translocase protein TatA
MFDDIMIGALEIIVLLIAALFFYGPEKLPELAHAAGLAYGEFKKAELSTEFGLSDLDMQAKKNDEKDLESKIKDMAISSGIEVRGKSTDELLELIAEAAKNKLVEAKT